MTDNLRAALIRVFSLDSNPGVLVVRARPEALADEVIRELSAQGVALASPEPLVAPATGEGLDVERLARAFAAIDAEGRKDGMQYVYGPGFWRKVAAKYARLAATTLDPGEAEPR